MLNANYYRIRNMVIEGCGKEDIEKVDRELKKYISVIETFTPKQMTLFSLLVEQASILKSNKNFDRFSAAVERAFIGYISEREDNWNVILKELEIVSKIIIENYGYENEVYKKVGGELKKMNELIDKDIEKVSIRIKELLKEKKKQKAIVEAIKKEFSNLPSSIIISTYKKVKNEIEAVEEAVTEVEEIEAVEEAEENPTKENTTMDMDIRIKVKCNNRKYIIEDDKILLIFPSGEEFTFQNRTEFRNFIEELKTIDNIKITF